MSNLSNTYVVKSKSPLKLSEKEIEDGEIAPAGAGNNLQCVLVVPGKESQNRVLNDEEEQSHDQISAEVVGKDNTRINTEDQVMEDNKEGWSLVSPGKGCNSNEKKQNQLTFGQVTIVFPSRFSVLSENEENLEKAQTGNIDTMANAETEETLKDDVVQDTTESEKQMPLEAATTSSQRAPLPRSSRSSHKVFGGISTQKAKDNVQSTSSRRSSKKIINVRVLLECARI